MENTTETQLDILIKNAEDCGRMEVKAKVLTAYSSMLELSKTEVEKFSRADDSIKQYHMGRVEGFNIALQKIKYIIENI